MTTSRTGTARWKRIRAQAIARAMADGVTRCPLCGRELDYAPGARHNGAVEIDHITPHALGGEDHIENTRPLCRRCNRARTAAIGKRRSRSVAANRVTRRAGEQAVEW